MKRFLTVLIIAVALATALPTVSHADMDEVCTARLELVMYQLSELDKLALARDVEIERLVALSDATPDVEDKIKVFAELQLVIGKRIGTFEVMKISISQLEECGVSPDEIYRGQ